jgi:hypothetical protein
LSSSLKLYGEAINLDELNKMVGLPQKFVRSVEVKRIDYITNDIRWLLGVENTLPSDHFKWFESPLENG